MVRRGLIFATIPAVRAGGWSARSSWTSRAPRAGRLAARARSFVCIATWVLTAACSRSNVDLAGPASHPPADAAVQDAAAPRTFDGAPLCTGVRGLTQGAVHADSEAVHVVVTDAWGVLWIGSHDGDGWTRRYQTHQVLREPGLDRFADGTLLLHGTNGCGLRHIGADGAAECTAEVRSVWDAFVVDASRAYAAADRSVLVREGSLWRPFDDELGPTFAGIWADSRQVIGVRETLEEQVLRAPAEGGEWQALPSLPAGLYGTLWSGGGNEIWVGGRLSGTEPIATMLTWDGHTWTTAWRGHREDCETHVRAVSGVEDRVFFQAERTFGVWHDDSAETLLEFDCDGTMGMIDMHAVSPSEVFILVQDLALEETPCGSTLLYHYDGRRFHSL